MALVTLTSLAGTARASRVYVTGVDVGTALPPSTTRSLTDTVAGAVSRAGHDVVTTQQLEALLGLEAAKQLAGCSDDGCVARVSADLGGALGVDAIVTAAVSKAGSGLVVAVKRIGVAGIGGRVADKRVKSKRIDAVLDVLPALVTEALAGLAATTTTTTTTTTPAAPTTAVAGGHLPAGFAAGTPPAARRQTPLSLTPEQQAALKVVDDGAGHVIVYNGARALDGPLLAGTPSGGVYAQRVIGGGAEGDVAFDLTFWDSRFSRGAERGFGLRDGVFTLTCGAQTTTFRPASASVAKRTLAKIYDVAWQRHVILVGRDDDLNWYIVDDSLDDTDPRVWAGRKVKGSYRFSVIDGEVVRDPTFGEGVLLVGEGYKIKLGPTGGEVSRGEAKQPLSALDLYAHAADVYGVMKPWGDVGLGTPCDG